VAGGLTSGKLLRARYPRIDSQLEHNTPGNAVGP